VGLIDRLALPLPRFLSPRPPPEVTLSNALVFVLTFKSLHFICRTNSSEKPPPPKNELTSCQSFNTVAKEFGAHLTHGLLAGRPNCNIPPLVVYSGQNYWWQMVMPSGKWTFLFSPSSFFLLLLLLYPSQYGDIISLTVSTRVHLVIHIIKETKTKRCVFKSTSMY